MSYFLPYTFQISFKIFLMYIHKIIFKTQAGVKKSKNFHLSPGQVHQNFYLSCYQITCPCQGQIDYQ